MRINPPSIVPTPFIAPLRAVMSAGNRCLLVAEPGAGKTTRAPLALLADTPPEAGRWLLLEPRRVAGGKRPRSSMTPAMRPPLTAGRSLSRMMTCAMPLISG